MLSSKKTRITPGALCGSFCFLLFWWPRAERRHIGGSLTLRGALRKNAGGAGTVPPGVLRICLPAGPALAALTANVEAALSRTGEAAAHPASTAAETPGRGGEGAEARGGGQGPGVFFFYSGNGRFFPLTLGPGLPPGLHTASPALRTEGTRPDGET